MQKKINLLFKNEDENLLKSLIGKEVTKIRHDKFDFSNVSYRRVLLFVKDKVFELENPAEEIDFMWDDFGDETVGVFKFHQTIDNGIDFNYGFDNYPKQIETVVNQKVNDIVVIEDNVKAYNSKTRGFISEYDYIKGIIIDFGDFKYCFYRSVWFSDDIYIEKGQTPENRIGNIDDDWEWGEERYSINTRKLRSLKAN